MRALAMVVALALVAPAARAGKATTAEARAIYERAIAHYDLAEYEIAIGEFKEAYALSREPALLFNIAQACRLQRQYDQALYFYQKYLQLMPDASNRADAEEQIRKMKQASEAAAKAHVAEPTPAPTPAPAPVAAPAPAAAPPPSPHFLQTRRGRAAIALAVVGGAALIAAAATGGEALAIRSRYDAGCTTGTCDGGLYSRGHGYAIATDVLLPVGVALAVVATVVALVHRHERPLTVGARF